MKYVVEFDSDGSFSANMNGSNNLEHIISHLIGGYNAYKNIEEFFDKNELAKKMLKDELDDMARNGNCSISIAMKCVLDYVFDKLKDDYEEDDEESVIKNLQDACWNLRKENRQLRQKLEAIKDAMGK